MRERLLTPWRGVTGILAALLVLGQVLFRGQILLDGYYTQDDYTMLLLGSESSFGITYLFQEYSGHVWPGGFLITWLTAHLAPESWTATALFLMALQTIGAVLMWLVLSRLLPSSRWRLPLLAVFLFSPTTLWSLQWWAQAIGYLPVTACLLLAVWALLVRLQDDKRWASWLVVIAFVLGVSFQERAFLFPLVLGGLAACFSARTSLWQGCWSALTRLRILWATLAAASVGLFALHRAISAGSSADGEQLPLRHFSDVGVDLVFRTLLPGLWGGPWEAEVISEGALMPSDHVVLIAVGLSVAVLLLLLWAGRMHARGALLLLALYVVADLILLFGGRLQSGFDPGLLPRYAADIVPVAVICGALALRGVRERRPGWSQIRWAHPVLMVGTALYLVGAIATSVTLAPHQKHHDDRRYVANLTDSLKDDPTATVYDSRPPEGMMVFWFDESQRVSSLAPVVPLDLPINVPGPNLKVVAPTGELVTPAMAYQVPFSLPETDCPVTVTNDPVTVWRHEPLNVDEQLLRLAYYSADDAFLTVTVDGVEQTTIFEAGAGVIDFVIDHARTNHVTLRLDRAATVCVTEMSTGFPVVPGAG